MIEKALLKQITATEHIQRALAVDGVHVIAVGSPACLRTLYFRACQTGFPQNLSLILPSASDFAQQHTLSLIEQHIHTLMAKKYPITGFILYLSCLDILLSTDYDELIQTVEKQYSVPMKIFRRGPLEKRVANPQKTLDSILKTLEKQMISPVPEKYQPNFYHPPLSSDYSGAISMIYPLNGLCLLLTPGGCIHNIVETDEYRDLEKTHLFYTRFNDLELALGIEEELLHQIETLRESIFQSDFLLLLGTPTTYITATSMEYMTEFLSQQYEMPVLFIETNGFQDYREGIRQLIDTLIRKFSRPSHTARTKISILGINSLEFSDKETIEALFQFFRDIDLEVNCPDIDGLKAYEHAADSFFTLCVSDVAIDGAKYLYDKFEIPYSCMFPVGIGALIRLMDELLRAQMILLENERFQKKYQLLCHQKVELQHHSLFFDEKITFLGDPPLHKGLQYCLLEDHGISSTLKTLPSFDFEERSIYIGDPIFLHSSIKQLIEVPYVALGGREVASKSVNLFGLNGNHFLIQELNKRRSL